MECLLARCCKIGTLLVLNYSYLTCLTVLGQRLNRCQCTGNHLSWHHQLLTRVLRSTRRHVHFEPCRWFYNMSFPISLWEPHITKCVISSADNSFTFIPKCCNVNLHILLLFQILDLSSVVTVNIYSLVYTVVCFMPGHMKDGSKHPHDQSSSFCISWCIYSCKYDNKTWYTYVFCDYFWVGDSTFILYC